MDPSSDRTAIKNWYIDMEASIAILRPKYSPMLCCLMARGVHRFPNHEQEEVPLLYADRHESDSPEASASLYYSDGEYVNIHEITTNSPSLSLLSIGFNSYLNIKCESPYFCIDINNCRQDQPLSAQRISISPTMLVDSRQIVLNDVKEERFQQDLFEKEMGEKSYGPKLSKFLSNLSIPICQTMSRLFPRFIIYNSKEHTEKDQPGAFSEQEPNLSSSLSIQYPVSMLDLAFCLEANSVFLKRE
ncbi:hypothetical protein DI09_198p40 [Mitosporidium daphniae]|uniref:Uncharacterized protein n=1 Tax=Mitosporidium daphniae TaxID=1485682 RepID=A0A098VTU9_9MICR|nr:uncharacterized protein DI09_198p40 [Mitosporidium daphniae]KGG52264.1 hypothetical protein DI09_198p40 [Mitosporidium daphniae]|eukprot:XP_013238700.1 uncharacterized protein DI09_198p40 [Mitosporidium daphniae]